MRRSWAVVGIVLGVAVATVAQAQGPSAQLDALLATRDFGRVPQTQSADWAYAMSIARAGQKAWGIQETAHGGDIKRAYDVRSILFVYAAREVLRWQDRYLEPTNIGGKFEGRYALASYIAGLYLEYAGNFWQARTYLGYAQAELTALKPGQSVPSYNKVRLDLAVDQEINMVDGVLGRYGAQPPYERTSHFTMSNTSIFDETKAAADFVLQQSASDPKLVQGPRSNPVSAEPQ
jgi:hypothetical protein